MHVTFAGMSNSSLVESNRHTHPVWEIIVNTEGAGFMQIGEKNYVFAPGTVCCVPPGVSHYKRADGGFRDMYVSVRSESLDGNKEYFVEDDEEKSIESLVYMIIKTFHKKDNNHIAIADALVESVCNMIIGKMTQAKPKNREIELFIDQLILNYNDCGFTVSQAMSVTNYNKDHFRRLFKQYTGKTPVEYLTSLRIRNAKNMLATSDKKSVKMIAIESGFSDYLYFAKVFRKYVGMTPSEYANSKKTKG